MKKLLLALCATVPALSLGACATDYGYGYGPSYYGGPYSYAGYYDGFYGPIYDGYWGNDNYFYYRGGIGDRAYRRGDHAHFSRSGGGGNWRQFQGTMTPSRGMMMPHFQRGGGRGWHHHRGG